MSNTHRTLQIIFSKYQGGPEPKTNFWRTAKYSVYWINLFLPSNFQSDWKSSTGGKKSFLPSGVNSSSTPVFFYMNSNIHTNIFDFVHLTIVLIQPSNKKQHKKVHEFRCPNLKQKVSSICFPIFYIFPVFWMLNSGEFEYKYKQQSL